jgi:hypothetical protein
MAVAALRLVWAGLFLFPGKAGVPISLYVAGSFFLGWSLLLIWADRRPQERSGVLLLTLLSVLSAWVVSEIYFAVAPGVSFTARLPFWILQACFSFLFTFNYLQARRAYPKWWSQRA